MKHFAALFQILDQNKKAPARIAALEHYFSLVNDQEKRWAIALFSSKRPKRLLRTEQLLDVASLASSLPAWLFEASHEMVSDLNETIALLLPAAQQGSKQRSLAEWIEYMDILRGADEDTLHHSIREAWTRLDSSERLIFNKLITGMFRMRLAQNQLVAALERHTGIERNRLEHRLAGDWKPEQTSFRKLVLEASGGEVASKPYPFQASGTLLGHADVLGVATDYLAEYKWDGLRCQAIFRNKAIYLWSKDGQLITKQYPELDGLKNGLPEGTVLDGELLAHNDGKLGNVLELKNRMGRVKPTKAILAKTPVLYKVFDLLEWEGVDRRGEALINRRAIARELVEKINNPTLLQFSENIVFKNWEEADAARDKAREKSAEGLVLKALKAPYGNEAPTTWMNWHSASLRIVAVLVYANRGPSGSYDEGSFAVWEGKNLVSFCKLALQLSEADQKAINQFVRKNTLERFGPVRVLRPELIFEISFASVHASKRHKSGLVLQKPELMQWLKTATPDQANDLAALQRLV